MSCMNFHLLCLKCTWYFIDFMNLCSVAVLCAAPAQTYHVESFLVLCNMNYMRELWLPWAVVATGRRRNFAKKKNLLVLCFPPPQLPHPSLLVFVDTHRHLFALSTEGCKRIHALGFQCRLCSFVFCTISTQNWQNDKIILYSFLLWI